MHVYTAADIKQIYKLTQIDALSRGQLVMAIILSEIRGKVIENVQLLYPTQSNV